MVAMGVAMLFVNIIKNRPFWYSIQEILIINHSSLTSQVNIHHNHSD